jgi:hypothetical protein
MNPLQINTSGYDDLPGAIAMDHANAIKDLANEIAISDYGIHLPNIYVVPTAEGLPGSLKVDPDTGLPDRAYQSAAGVYDGKSVWIVADKFTVNTAGFDRLRMTIAHEVIGHFGMEHIVKQDLGEDGWERIRDGLLYLEITGTGSEALQTIMMDVRRMYPGATNDVFAREAMAVMAERGVRNSLVDRVLAATRSFIRRIIPSLPMHEREMRLLVVSSAEHTRKFNALASRSAAAVVNFTGPDSDLFQMRSGDRSAQPSPTNAPKKTTEEQVNAWTSDALQRLPDDPHGAAASAYEAGRYGLPMPDVLASYPDLAKEYAAGERDAAESVDLDDDPNEITYEEAVSILGDWEPEDYNTDNVAPEPLHLNDDMRLELRETLGRPDATFTIAEPNHTYSGTVIGFALGRQFLVQDSYTHDENHFILHPVGRISPEVSRMWSSHEPGEKWRISGKNRTISYDAETSRAVITYLSDDDAFDIYLRGVEARISSWNGQSVSDLPYDTFENFPELFDSDHLRATVPETYRGLINGADVNVDAANSLAYERDSLEILAIDQQGKALVRNTRFYNYEDVDVDRHEIIERADAFRRADKLRAERLAQELTDPQVAELQMARVRVEIVRAPVNGTVEAFDRYYADHESRRLLGSWIDHGQSDESILIQAYRQALDQEALLRLDTTSRNTKEIDDMTQSDQNNSLAQSDREIRAMLQEVAADYVLTHVNTTAAREKPVAILLAAQPGAGTPSLVQQLQDDYRLQGSFIAIDNDMMREHLPFVDVGPDGRPTIIANRMTEALSQSVTHEAVRLRRNVVIEAPSDDPEKAVLLAKELRQAGYTVELHALAVNDQISFERTTAQFERDRLYNAETKAVTHDYHDKSFYGTSTVLRRLEFAGAVDRMVIYNRLQDVIYDKPPTTGSATAVHVLDKARNQLTTFERTSLASHWDDLSEKLKGHQLEVKHHMQIQNAVARAHYTLRRSSEAASHFDLQNPSRRDESVALAQKYAQRLSVTFLDPSVVSVQKYPELAQAFAVKDHMIAMGRAPADVTRQIADILAQGQLPKVIQGNPLGLEWERLKKNLKDVTDSIKIVEESGMPLDSRDRQELIEAQRELNDFVSKHSQVLAKSTLRESPTATPAAPQNVVRQTVKPV